MVRQSNQLLALARAEPGRAERKRLAPVDLADLVSQVVQYFVMAASKKQIDIGFELEPAPVVGDAFLLRDLIDNLIDNAVRYTPDGGTVTVSCGMRGTRSRLRVLDSGPGIAPSRRAEVFRRHVRLSADTTGSGLGLAIVRDVAQVHEATVTLSDPPLGGGLLVTVEFPPA
jgi:two-component system sensor histidine kinase TctE